jgi:hypothetical protein
MKVHISIVPGGVLVQARAEGDGDLVGDLGQLVTPSESFGQFTHDELVAMGEGEHDLDLVDVED